MLDHDLKIQKQLVDTHRELKKEYEANKAEVYRLGHRQRNALVRHVYSDFQNHEELNERVNSWSSAMARGDVLKLLMDIFRCHQNLYGYYDNYQVMLADIDQLIKKAVERQQFRRAEELKRWRDKLPLF